MNAQGGAKTQDVLQGLRAACPELFPAVDSLATEWLRPVELRLQAIAENRDEAPRAKHVNDPVWRTFELEPHEVLLIDSPLLQRLRGVKQLGLANLVFPGANHDRFEHVCGTVQAAERVFRALEQNAARRREREGGDGPGITDRDRLTVRLAALLHDVGHGPFSHAIEPVVARRYRADLDTFNRIVHHHFDLDAKVAVAELISVLIVLSEAMGRVLATASFSRLFSQNAADLQLRLVTLIMGARRLGQFPFLSAIISGQVDADKLDYMTRDALHSGMPIEFDTERLLWKLEIVRCTPANLPPSQPANREYAEQCPNQSYFDLGIAASGVGALEQMLIGRAFLYDRVYHHHKVRAADAMAQRMLHFAVEDRGRPFDLADLYQPVSDDTLIRILAGHLTRGDFEGGGARASGLGSAILNRDLYVRAFAFRATFHTASASESDDAGKMAALAEAWTPVSTGLADINDRIAAEARIVEIAKTIAPHMGDDRLKELADRLEPRHVIVDLAENRVKPVTINVHAEDGALEAPNLFFDPARWSHVYDLQKRTGYVFCDRQFVGLVGLAAKIFFFEKWGYAVSEKGDRLTKTLNAVQHEWVDALLASDRIDEAMGAILKREAKPRTFVHESQIDWPAEWNHEDGTFDADFVDSLKVALPQGLSAGDRNALISAMEGLATFVHTMHNDAEFLKSDALERDLQTAVLRHLRARGMKVTEGAEFGGGETDLLVQERLLIENKIAGEAADPYSVKPATPYQTNRYSVAICSRVFVTLLAYKPKQSANPIEQTQSIRVTPLTGLSRTAVNIQVVVPYGMPTPSKVGKPAK